MGKINCIDIKMGTIVMMRSIKISTVHLLGGVICIIFFITTSIAAAPLITNNIGGGRLGDQLLVYIKAKWFAHYYNGDFSLTLFDGFEHFDFFLREQQIDVSAKRRILLDDESPLLHNAGHDTSVYLAHLHTKSSLWEHWYDHTTWHRCIDDQTFRSQLRKLFKPTYAVPLIPLPTDCISVALHVRKGGGFDKPTLSPTIVNPLSDDERYMQYADQAAPLKFAPDSFYIAALRTLSDIFDNAPLYVYLFTDDQNPSAIVDAYTKILAMPHIRFDFRDSENGPDEHVVDDMINMSRFDCLIRSESSFSKIADIIGNHKLILFPHAHRWHQGVLHITEMTAINKGIRSIIPLSSDKE
jgi:hypothetical protein